MRINKEDSNILRDTADDIGAYLGRLNEPNTGRLDRATIESMDTELDSNDYAQSKSGTLSGSYVESHSVDIEDIDIASAPIQRRLNQEYYEKHNQSFDEPAIRVNNPTLKPTDSKTELEEDSIVSRIPFDVQVKMAFLEKRTVRCSGTSVFLYKDECGYFEELNETSLQIAIRESISKDMDLKLTKHKIADVVHRIVSSPELQVNYDEFNSQIHLINFKNGVYNIKTRTIHRHSPNYLFTSFIDAEYGDPPSSLRVYLPRNGCSETKGYYFKRFLEDCTEGDLLKIKSLQQLTGYIISNEWRAKKFFVLIGLPHTGKSVWLELWRTLIGSKHTTAMSLKQLGETRFMTAELFKSKLNISAEMDENGSIKATDVIKTITGCDLLTGEKKGKDPFQFYSKTKLVAAGNHMPLLNKLDGTSAFTDRILFFMFNNTIPEENRDKSLIDKLINEKTFIVEWAIEGLVDLLDNNLIFTESEEAHAFKQRYINELNNVSEFIRDRCHVDLDNEECKVHRKVIYPAYKLYCHDNGFKAISKQEFFVEILKLNVKPGKLRIDGSTPLQGFRGIRLMTSNELKLLKG